ncbi:MAG: ChbG/HpnK family deacetylase [Acidobacteria bacterium]|nr:ChbG/HpnK family deacetylase [Acidobacteriota bacterium]
MKSLIVNADDFGLTSGVNRAVIEGHTRGIITSSTIMANMGAFDDAVSLAKDHPSLGVGLHFNITQGTPVAGAANVRSLTDMRGEFLSSSALIPRILIGQMRVEEIEVELRAQIEKVLNAGLRLTHIDSHKHSHALPQVCDVLVNTIGEYGISAIRLPQEKWRFNAGNGSIKMITQSIGALFLAQLCRVSSERMRKAKIRTTDAILGISQSGFLTKQLMLKIIERLPEGVSELMCHPGYDDDELKTVKTRLRSSRMTELKLLTDPEIIEKIRDSQVKLTSWMF